MTNEVESVPPATSPDGGTHEDWRHAARCRNTDPDTLFVQGAQQRDAREVCRACPVRTECLAHALDNRIRFGVWGGMTERERRALLRKRPEVISWAALLESARRAAQRSPAARSGAAPAVAGGRAVQARRAEAPRAAEAAATSPRVRRPGREAG